MTKPTPRMLLAQRAPVEGYPPVLRQARILRTLGKFMILDSGNFSIGSGSLTALDVHRVRVSMGNGSRTATERVNRLRAALRFQGVFVRELASAPDVVIAFEPEAAAMLLNPSRSSRPGPLQIVQLHEHPTTDAYAGSMFGRLGLRRTLSRLGMSDVLA